MGISLQNVSKRFGTVGIINDVSMEIPTGAFAVFVGPSGCGKSTLLRMIAGLEDTTSGSISIEGRDVTDVEPAKREVAMVFQSYALYPHLTVYENMAFSLKLKKTSKSEIDEMVNEAARILHLEDHLKKRPSELSGGQRQRVAIGRAIVRKPKVFLFDEPLSNLDAELRVQMRLELAKLHKQIGATMIYVTHDQVEAMTLADRIFVLKGGVVQQTGKPLELYDNPNNHFVGGFIGSPAMNFLPGRVLGRQGETIRIGLEGISNEVLAKVSSNIADGTAVKIGLRPEHLRPIEGGFAVTVEMEEDLGGVSYLHTRLSDGRAVVVETRGRAERLDGDLSLTLGADPGDVLVFTEDGQRMR
ncbi:MULTISPECIES: ABC transporter ATP-binding protein [unclassified Rhizobium]|uniref:ABC transporter ATP-binding protein n=1 Tax=unclassified Rhizobium TaxID=2613769 RepID=UPI00177D4436|nr:MULTISPECIES: sn-glycerol-3-phosphate ABC transporter ATP-binding protein UgpC [unclassified Rhizobium]MBD8689929.1 sn-glycerol-3-phosphate ABC transporter ATP-binding protein UgpC [Rhizobium sp. CFBP 13644]MBD8694519.1 sn-glycerol-3-phosphate ABC transporter ATP-binding protein UgpC [Rhizobium sp. CFBP 13717]